MIPRSVLERERLGLLQQPCAGHVPGLVAVRRADQGAVRAPDDLGVLGGAACPLVIDEVDRIGLRHLLAWQRQVLRP